MAARATLLVLAVAMLGCLGLMLRNAHQRAAAERVLFRNPPPTRTQFEAAVKQLKSADLLNPDTSPRVSRGAFIQTKRPREALKIGNEVVAKEPDNLGAWTLVFSAAQPVDPARAQQAKVQILRLDPLAAQGLRR